MGKWVLRRTDGRSGYYVAVSGSPKSYIRSKYSPNTRRFDTREQAVYASCKGNEVPEKLT